MPATGAAAPAARVYSMTDGALDVFVREFGCCTTNNSVGYRLRVALDVRRTTFLSDPNKGNIHHDVLMSIWHLILSFASSCNNLQQECVQTVSAEL